jgi:SAM-dependent methyltransferase
VGSRYDNLERLKGYFEQRWRRAAGAAPWGDTRACPIERAKAELLAPHLAGVRTVLDLGCGGGDFLSMIAPLEGFDRAVGIDCAPGAIDRARASGLYHELHVAFVEEAAELVTGRFDLVLLSEVLYYVPDPLAVVAMAADRFVADGGMLGLALAVGRDYFGQGEVERTRALLGKKLLLPLVDDEVHYRAFGLRKRAFGPVFPQTHKVVWLWRRRPAAGRQRAVVGAHAASD